MVRVVVRTPSDEVCFAMSDSPSPAHRQPPTGSPPPADAPDEGQDRYSEALRRFSGDLRMVRQVWQSMLDRRVPLAAEHYRLLLDAHLAGRDLDGARDILDQMTAAGVEADAQIRWRLAVAAGRAGRTSEATRLLDQLRDEKIDPPDDQLPALFSTELAAGRLPAAYVLLRRMAARRMAAQPAEYQVLLADILERRAIKDGKALIDAMLAGGHVPAVADVQRIVAMTARGGHAARAERLLATLAEHDITMPPEIRTEIVVSWARSGEVERTREALAAIEDAGGVATSHHHNALLAAVIRTGDVDASWQQALHLAARAIPSGASLEGLIDLSVAAKRPELALSAIDWLLMLGVPATPRQVVDVAGVLIAGGRLDEAVEIFSETARRGVAPDRRTARSLVDGLVSAGRVDDALVLLERLRGQKVLTTGRHWGPVISALVRSRRTQDAAKLLRDLLAHDIQPTVADASLVVGAQVRTHQHDEACSLIDLLADRGIGVDEPTYRELMWAYARKGHYDQTKQVHDRMVAAGITPDEHHEKALAWASGETRRRLDRDDADGS